MFSNRSALKMRETGHIWINELHIEMWISGGPSATSIFRVALSALEHRSRHENNRLAPGTLVGMDDGLRCGNHVLTAGN